MGIKKMSNSCMKAMIDEDFSQSDIARACNITRQAVSLRVHQTAWTQAVLKRYQKATRIYWLWIQGVTTVRIARRLHICTPNVYQILNRYYPELLPARRTRRARTSKAPWTPKQLELYRTRYKLYWFKIQGLKDEEIAARLNIKCSRVRSIRFRFFPELTKPHRGAPRKPHASQVASYKGTKGEGILEAPSGL